MANWRLEIKKIFADNVVAAIPDIKYFGSWDSQKDNFREEETRPPLGIFFEYSIIGDGLEYLLTRDMQQAERVPVEVTLHVCFNNYSEQHQDLAYEYADALTCQLSGLKDDLIHGRVLKSFEREDINYNAPYDYQIGFAFHIKEAVFLDEDKQPDNVNPETEVDPNPDTGRRLKPIIIQTIKK